jgi:hypothetical protein
MEIRQFRVVIRAKDFEHSCRFYGDTLALPRLQNWERDDGRGALYQAGTAVVEVLGRPAGAGSRGRDESFDYQGPHHKLVLVVLVPSAEKAYEDLRWLSPLRHPRPRRRPHPFQTAIHLTGGRAARDRGWYPSGRDRAPVPAISGDGLPRCSPPPRGPDRQAGGLRARLLGGARRA